MKISITFSKKFRKNLVIACNLIRTILVAFGLPMALLFATGLNAPGDAGVNATKAVIVCLGMTLAGMFLEMFTVRFLILEGEHIATIFDFDFYGLKSRANYIEYRRYMKKRQAARDNSRVESNQSRVTVKNSNVYNINTRKVL